ncbi:MAG: ribose 5-phosphate isomerase A [Betaproteobacteria bacterium TMED41]|nr:MAG: ribose 5-phosphate isomerase A [Betaproteobacteria bacterium TMED41]|tara:strand:+ start:636 stop:1295 length:660 start_codon:yes stop_codon:yes gene_type:complete
MKDQLKFLAANGALKYLKPEMRIGVGTGSTVDIFIDALSESGLSFSEIFTTSKRSEERLKSRGFTVLNLTEVKEPLPIYVDGADEIDQSLCMIKGGGGALTLEKIVAELANFFVCIVDERKYVQKLGKFPIPVEVISEAIVPICWAIRDELGGKPIIRKNFVSEHGHKILDVHNLHLTNPMDVEIKLNSIPGVVTNGIFANRRADLLLVGTTLGLKTFQ